MTVSGVAAFPIQILDGTAKGVPVSALVYGDSAALMLYAPGTLANTYTIETHYNDRATGLETDWKTLVDSSGNNIIPPTAGKARWYVELPPAGSFRFAANAPVTSDVTFYATKLYTG